MSQSTAKSERVTATISTLVAIAILAAGVTAQQSRNAPQDDLTLLESDLRFQLDRAFRHQPKQREQRTAQLEAALKAWWQSPQSNNDRNLLTQWLLESTIRSMPGTTQPLPDTPVFGSKVPQEIEQPISDQPIADQQVSKQPQSELPDIREIPVAARAVAALQQQAEAQPDPFADELAIAEYQILEAIPTDEPMPVAARQSDVKQPTQVQRPIKINTTELAARIAGYHQGLDRLETTLLTTNTAKLDFVSSQVQQLDELTQDFQFVKLYYDALSEKERRNMHSPRSIDATLAEIQRLLNRIEEGQNGDFLGTFDTSKVDRISQLRQQLADVASRVN